MIQYIQIVNSLTKNRLLKSGDGSALYLTFYDAYALPYAYVLRVSSHAS